MHAHAWVVQGDGVHHTSFRHGFSSRSARAVRVCGRRDNVKDVEGNSFANLACAKLACANLARACKASAPTCPDGKQPFIRSGKDLSGAKNTRNQTFASVAFASSGAKLAGYPTQPTYWVQGCAEPLCAISEHVDHTKKHTWSASDLQQESSLS